MVETLLQFVRGRVPLWFLFAGIAAVAAALGLGRWWWLGVEAQREAVRHLRDKGWEVAYPYELDAKEPNGPPLLVEWLGVDAFNDVTWAHVSADPRRDLEDEEIGSLNRLPRLIRLSLFNSRLATEKAEQLRLGELRELAVHHCEMNDEALATFCRCPRLESIEVEVYDFAVRGSFLVALCEACELQTVSLTVHQMDSGAIEALSRETSLRELRLSGPLTDAQVEIATRPVGLETLYFDGPGMTNLSLRHIARCSLLTRLYLRKTPVTSDGLASLKGLKHLKALHLLNMEIDDSMLAAVDGLAPPLKEFWSGELSDTAVARLKAKGISVNGK